jgi:hypothetical protein
MASTAAACALKAHGHAIAASPHAGPLHLFPHIRTRRQYRANAAALADRHDDARCSGSPANTCYSVSSDRAIAAPGALKLQARLASQPNDPQRGWLGVEMEAA